MRRFELPKQWEPLPALRQTVEELLAGSRRRTALDEVLRHLRHAPESTDALFLALVVLGQSRTELLESDEPLTDTQRVSALLAPVATECSNCGVLWYSRHTVLNANGPTKLTIGNPIGLQCQNCRYTLCRNCLSKGVQSYTAPVDAPELPGRPCPNSGSHGQLTTPVLPTGRHGVTPMDPDGIEGVIIARDGFILPTMEEALVVVTKFLPLIADDAPLIHLRRSVPGTMSDESTRDELALSLVLELEREGPMAPGAWARSRRMFVLAGAANDTDYLVTVVRKREQHPSSSALLHATPSATYTYLMQILARDGGWGILRDPHSGHVIEGSFGAVTAPKDMLPDIAQEVMEKFNRFRLKRRVAFFEGDRTKQKLTTDDVYGVVSEGSKTVVPYSDDPA
ncbi:hypothetical protein [Streptomyces sp. NBC_00162]|uniref:hypothetical protein n=1 Tax=Streptomyces sp. NBC_00162 TaxID=2903629 RepID=UPI00214B1DE3|nr:hypothetical protein [Streptomyces sp. NBC_00162]UUU43373.1 hypothetical protein JIW86_33875 [Streptomyces sp. NBC_00162]